MTDSITAAVKESDAAKDAAANPVMSREWITANVSELWRAGILSAFDKLVKAAAIKLAADPKALRELAIAEWTATDSDAVKAYRAAIAKTHKERELISRKVVAVELAEAKIAASLDKAISPALTNLTQESAGIMATAGSEYNVAREALVSALKFDETAKAEIAKNGLPSFPGKPSVSRGKSNGKASTGDTFRPRLSRATISIDGGNVADVKAKGKYVTIGDIASLIDYKGSLTKTLIQQNNGVPEFAPTGSGPFTVTLSGHTYAITLYGRTFDPTADKKDNGGNGAGGKAATVSTESIPPNGAAESPAVSTESPAEMVQPESTDTE
jgi:hypothetical protein